MLAQIDLGDDLANGSVRLTTRQGIQHHGVIKGDLKAYIQKINAIQLTTLAACGDVERNVMCCPAPIRNNSVRDEMMAKAEELAEALAPRTTAYHEIWLTDDETGEKTLAAGGSNGHEVEQFMARLIYPESSRQPSHCRKTIVLTSTRMI